MNTIEINTPFYKCGECKTVYNDKAWADKCCKPKICEDCGCELKHNWYMTVCTACHDKRVLDRAEKITIEEYHKRYGDNMIVLGNNYYYDIDDAIEQWEDSFYPDPIDEAERPQFVFGTTKEYMQIDAGWMIERATEDAYEDAEFDDVAVKELHGFVDKWNDKYKKPYYCENEKIAIIVPQND